MYKYASPVQALLLYQGYNFDVLLYRTPAKLLIADETLGIPFNFNFLFVSDGTIPTPSLPYPKHGAGECRHPCEALVLY